MQRQPWTAGTAPGITGEQSCRPQPVSRRCATCTAPHRRRGSGFRPPPRSSSSSPSSCWPSRTAAEVPAAEAEVVTEPPASDANRVDLRVARVTRGGWRRSSRPVGSSSQAGHPSEQAAAISPAPYAPPGLPETGSEPPRPVDDRRVPDRAPPTGRMAPLGEDRPNPPRTESRVGDTAACRVFRSPPRHRYGAKSDSGA